MAAENVAALLGRVVSSKAGRDQGDRFVVVGALGEDMVLVADGQRRTMDRPKKKNVKHLILHEPAPALVEALARGERPRDEEIRMALVASGGAAVSGESGEMGPAPQTKAPGGVPEA